MNRGVSYLIVRLINLIGIQFVIVYNARNVGSKTVS